MNYIDSIIISGSSYFRCHLEEIIEKIFPGKVKITSTKGTGLRAALQKNNYSIAVVEENTEAARALIKQIKKISAATKVILFNDAVKEEIKEADFVFPGKISKQTSHELKSILLNRHLSPSRSTEKRKNENRQNYKSVHITVRKLEIFKGIWEKLTNKKIAERLFIDKRTVEGHRKELYKLTDSESVLDLIEFGIKQGWIDGNAELSEKFMQFLRGDARCTVNARKDQV